jgi:predicted LPLAT superfamily acyltransferase
MSPHVPDSGAPRRRNAQAWVAKPERGNLSLLRAMTVLSLRMGRRLTRPLLYLIVCYYWLTAPATARHIRRFQRRALKTPPHARDRFRQLLGFATCVHDRVFLLNDRYADFAIDVHNEALLERVLAQGRGCLLMGAHLGSFEITRSFGRQRPQVAVAMAMYAENARKISAVLAAINPRCSLAIIPLGNIDAMLQIQARLDAGEFVGMLADRTLGDEAVVQLNFLGSPAPFPLGPWRAAALLRRPVLFIAGLYCGGNRYRIVVDEIADFSTIPAAGRQQASHAAVVRYVEILDDYCRQYPYNWFNFFDFWHEQTSNS